MTGRVMADEARTGLPMADIRAGVPSVEVRSTALTAIAPPRPVRHRRIVIPALLVAGWGGLFAYCATYLREDLPFRPADAGAVAEDAPRRPFVIPAAPEAPSREKPPGAPPAEQAAPVLAATAPATPILPRPAQTDPGYVGTWGPTPAACGRPSRRRGYLPATITADRAKAGRTLCTFRDGHRTGNTWVMAADCSDRGRRWSSQVRLLVEGDHLTWTSNRGTASYTRCPRRPG